MSRTIDERIVEMRFDNRQFERNVQTSLSTLDKLKQGLDLDGAAKGLENLGDAAKKCNMSALSSSVETVRAKFSALEVVAMTTLSNITNSALNTEKRLVSALTIDPIKTGFQEYETQIGAVQTILANTQHEGTNLQQVNRALDELNTYADKTIYNFTEMTRNIGTFTAAGVKLQTSVDSIKGIANLAAISGSTSQQASTAMYQLSQALAAGRVSLMDWNSVVNAGMGGKVFQDALVRTSELLGTGAQNAINMYGFLPGIPYQGRVAHHGSPHGDPEAVCRRIYRGGSGAAGLYGGPGKGNCPDGTDGRGRRYEGENLYPAMGHLEGERPVGMDRDVGDSGWRL